MTGMLASVRDLAEARVVLAAGVDLIDLKEPSAGALGALDDATRRRIVRFVNGKVPVSATIGDLPCEARALDAAIGRTAACGVDLVKVGILAPRMDKGILRVMERRCSEGGRVILVFFAEFGTGGIAFRELADAGITGVMMDTVDKDSGSLTRKLDHAFLGSFVTEARSAGLLTGLAGSLSAAEVRGLLALRPDYLGFRGALCVAGRRGHGIDPCAVATIRDLLRGGAAIPDRSPAPAAA